MYSDKLGKEKLHRLCLSLKQELSTEVNVGSSNHSPRSCHRFTLVLDQLRMSIPQAGCSAEHVSWTDIPSLTEIVDARLSPRGVIYLASILPGPSPRYGRLEDLEDRGVSQ